ncbi:hydrogenase maturation nickel metallochaperone HypA [Ideonella sp. 4Y11]|uniref:Hydrogenase maturation factor HypA n=1 Tax=Ideonella aquatica TaxID=2824119 RepID=A0A940YC62_9BURK|nr:hydrogenase maturation nickel metallochaperone HypA [Ideonella aquatica]MBQ0957470.1 hydrogenase maturation nickel metallochaperone HypA [Ideonella aquatica]
MHELSLAGGVLRLVEDAAQREGFARVSRLQLEAGALSGVEVRALRFGLDALRPGTVLEGAEIVIDEPAGTAWCLPCAQTVEIRSRADACPRCGGYQIQPTGGTELRVVDLWVHDDPAPETASTNEES